METKVYQTVIPELVMMICSIVCLIVGIKNRNKFHFLRYAYFYPLASFLPMLLSFLINLEPESQFKRYTLINYATHIFLLVEFITFYGIFLTILKNRIKILLIIIGCVYLLYIGFSFSTSRGLNYYPDDLFIWQAVVILIPVFYSLAEIVRIDIPYKRQKDPRFWITFGALLYFGCTLPLFLFLQPDIYSYWTITARLYFINDVCYSVLFLSISKAYLCPLPEQNNMRRDTPTLRTCR